MTEVVAELQESCQNTNLLWLSQRWPA